MLEELAKKQFLIAKKVVLRPLDENKINFIAGVDVSYFNGYSLGVVAILDKKLRVEKVVHSIEKTSFPYISGFLAFREIPIVLKCFELLQKEGAMPDIIIFDGQGIAHPRKAGLASHAGVILDLPTIGVAKKLLYGNCVPPKEVGQSSPIVNKDDTILGYAYLSKRNTNPIYISPGHLTDAESSLNFTKKLITSYKLPEPTRIAHLYTQKFKLQYQHYHF